jgi:hypothetical protein
MIMNRSSMFPRRALFPLYGVCVLLVLLGANTALGATYYVATSGNDANPGTSASPWRNPQKCVDPDSPLVAGDTCEVADGTYTSTTTGRVVVARSTAPAGTASNPITIRSANPLKAKIVIPNSWPGANCDIENCGFTAFTIMKPYYVIEGFEITRPGSFFAAKASINTIYLEAGATGAVIRRNWIHDVGRTICHDGWGPGSYSVSAMFLTGTSNVTVEDNRFHTIGRRLNGESGCVTNKYQHDHGVYATGSTNLTVRRNVFYDITRGTPLNIKSGSNTPGTITQGLKVYNNAFSGGVENHTNISLGHADLTDTLNDVQFKNNIFHDPYDGYILRFNQTSVATGPGIVLQNNLSNSTRVQTEWSEPYLRLTSGITYTNNITNTSPGFVDAAGNNFRLTSGSDAINAGTNVGLPFLGSAPDIGAYEFSQQNADEPPLAPMGLRVQ